MTILMTRDNFARCSRIFTELKHRVRGEYIPWQLLLYTRPAVVLLNVTLKSTAFEHELK